ncbi:MAG TPA: hypothetical protein VKG25_16980 [Bryobacteraceae bacterium]|nr:hypothetical protein [Bryobacteraceae bacterium]
MILRLFRLIAVCGLLTSCSPEPKKEPPQAAEAPAVHDESRRFPQANLVGTKVVQRQLLGKPFMPGGTVAAYKKGKTEWRLFLAQFPDATSAAIALPDWRKALADPKLEPSFGGYFGQDGGQPVFVFAKGAWIVGVSGLPEKDADAQARLLAAKL